MTIAAIVNTEPWTTQAPCRGLHDIFDYDPHRDGGRDAYTRAVAICRNSCPVLAECRDYAERTRPHPHSPAATSAISE